MLARRVSPLAFLGFATIFQHTAAITAISTAGVPTPPAAAPIK
jgi:hypothetical protein